MSHPTKLLLVDYKDFERMTQEIKFRSSIKSELLRRSLLRGTGLAILGALLLLAGAFLPARILGNWGALIFLLSMGLIAWGLIPYRRLKQLETIPHEIILDDHTLLFCWKREAVFQVPFSNIDKTAFISSGDVYGIGIWLSSTSICTYNNFDLVHFQERSRKKFGCDLFLPYFSERTFESLVRQEAKLRHRLC